MKDTALRLLVAAIALDGRGLRVLGIDRVEFDGREVVDDRNTFGSARRGRDRTTITVGSRSSTSIASRRLSTHCASTRITSTRRISTT